MSAAAAAPPAPDRPTVLVDHEEGRVARDVLRVLPEITDLFQRGGRLVQIAQDSGAEVPGLIRQPSAPRIRGLPKAILRRWIADRCELLRYNKDGELVPAHPPDWLVETLIQDGAWLGVRHLEAVVQSPMFVRHSRIVSQTGYDPHSGLYIAYPDRFAYSPVPEKPTKRQIDAAVAELTDWLCDFMFDKPEHRSALIASVLSYFARFAYKGGAPVFLLDSNVRSAGKSKLIDAVAALCLGREMDLSTQPVNETEQKKVLKTLAMSGTLMCKIDNVSRPFGNGVFDAAITSPVWTDTPLYTDDRITNPLYVLFFVNGNNVEFAKGCDTSSRTLHCRLNVPMERPEERSDFKHKDIIGHTHKRRSALASAALTVLKGYAAAGYPDQGLKAWSRFPEWSRLIRHALVWAGLPDPYAAHEQLVLQSDQTHGLLGDLLEGWAALCAYHKVPAMSAREALGELDGQIEQKQRMPQLRLRDERLINALLELAPTKTGRLPDAHRLGYLFRKYRGRVVRELRLVTLPDKSEDGALWTAERVP